LYSEDHTARSVLRAALSADYDVIVENREVEVKARLEQHKADVLILDFDHGAMSLESLLTFIAEIRELGVPILVMTDDARRSTAIELVEHGVYDYFRKPPHLAELKIIVGRAYEHSQLQFELKAAKQRLNRFSHCDHLIGTSEKMQKVYDLIRRVADLDANVVIRGESGTGKELVARAIHNLSARARQPFLAVPCGAIPETLIESEVFGYERGAFTGATQSKEGYFERVGSGTLFLDEMAEMSSHTQVKFLRVLQEREFGRVGGKKNYQLKARLLFATHRKLEEMVEKGEFREDLYYRMHVVKLEIPPLRERKEDIPALAEGFLRTYASAYGRPVKHLEPAAVRVLERHDWPGNVRELENVIQRAVILSETPLIRTEDLSPLLQEPVEIGANVHFIDAPFDYQVRVYKRRLIEAALQQCGGNKTRAAHKLGITRAYLHRILRQGSEAEYAENHEPSAKQRAS
jgi:DNA-binding NtrC family response regulator